MTLEEGLAIFDQVLVLYRSRWTLTSYAWEDLCQDLRMHFCKKFHLYDQTRPLKPWCARLIQSQIKNELRNKYYIFQKPCLRCPMYLGEEQCQLYGEISSKCSLYKKFLDQKGNASNVNFPVSYEQSNYDASQAFSCTPKELAENIYTCLSGVHKQIFHLFYESGFSTTKIARTILVSGSNFAERFEMVEDSIEETKKIAKDVVEDKKISMGIEHE